jgi:hypothetical protein
MVLSELTNKELKGILRENHVRNYSKLNKKGLLKKVNQLIKAQNGGGKKNGKGKNKKYTLKDLIGGTKPTDKNGKPIPPAKGSPPAGINYGINQSDAVNYSLLNSNAQAAAPPATASAPPATASATPANVTNSTLTKPTSIQQSVRPSPTVNETSQIPPVSIESTNISKASAPPLEDELAANPTTKNNALKVYSADPKNRNFIGKANGITPTKKYGNMQPNQTSTNNSANTKDECGACSIQ